MKILAIHLLKWNGENPYFITSAYELDFVRYP